MSEQKNSSFTPLDLGATGCVVADNIAALRQEKALSYNQLSKMLKDDFGHEIPPIGLRRIEARARKVTVDDLFALAMALETSPGRLLIQEYPAPAVATAVPKDTDRLLLRAWIEGRLRSFDLEDLLSFYEREINENSFTLKMKKHHLKQLHRGKKEFPDLLDYDTHIPMLEKTIIRYQQWLDEAEQKYKETSELVRQKFKTPPISDEELRDANDFFDTYNKLIAFED